MNPNKIDNRHININKNYYMHKYISRYAPGKQDQGSQVWPNNRVASQTLKTMGSNFNLVKKLGALPIDIH